MSSRLLTHATYKLYIHICIYIPSVVRGNFPKSNQTVTTQIIAKKIKSEKKKNNNNKNKKRSLQHHALSGIHCCFFLSLQFFFLFFLILSQKDKLVLLTLKKIRLIMHKCFCCCFSLSLYSVQFMYEIYFKTMYLNVYVFFSSTQRALISIIYFLFMLHK